MFKNFRNNETKMANAYLIFHLNLAFSSIEEEKRPTVIKNCYWPLLQLVEKTGICIGIELSGWTLQQIHKIDENWVLKFKELIHSGKCELIGSGWSQIIGPLVPYEVNIWNQKLAIDYYNCVLQISPRIVLVNEMAFSTSLIDIYKEVGYEAIVMDRDNIRLALNIENIDGFNMPTHAKGNNEEIFMPVLWSDSNLFQRFQRVIHNDITEEDYFNYLRTTINKHNLQLLPIYTNDVEIFDFRPGRFTTENKLNEFNEWNKIYDILIKISNFENLNWVSPTEAIEFINKQKIIAQKITSIRFPIPVKKQLKYNINRWAISGRNDLILNTVCHKKFKILIDQKIEKNENWKELCEMWSSDFRTHITEKRWSKLKENINSYIVKEKKVIKDVHVDSKSNFLNIDKDPENIYWIISTHKIKLKLNLRRGLTISSLAFKSNNFKPIIGTISQGYFSSIKYGVDYYSGGIIVDLPLERKKITDLDWVNPKVEYGKGYAKITVEIINEYFVLVKTIKILENEESLELSYDFNGFERPIGVVRVGIITFLEEFLNESKLKISCNNGGSILENFDVSHDCDHGKAVSSFVSSTTSLGAAGDNILIQSNDIGLKIEWNPHECAAVPMFKYKKIGSKVLSRLSFSLSELDDTTKKGGNLLPFKFKIHNL
jgi:hypothetical protein